MASAYRKLSKKYFNKVEVINLTRSASFARFIPKAEQAILSAAGISGRRVEVFLISDARMRFLNTKFRGKNTSTDILSFEYPREFPDAGSFKPLGEIYLNLSRIESGEKLLMLLTHGTLHLLGFVHGARGTREKMERAEGEVLSKAGNLL